MTGRHPASLKRPKRPAPQKRSLLVFTEGRVTEPVYLTDLARQHRETVVVEIADWHGVPHTLVDAAATAKTTAARDQRRGRGAAYDEVWCIFDVDEHPRLDEARAQAASTGVLLAVSNPCIELWFLLHVREQQANLHRAEAQARVAEALGFTKAPTATALDRLASAHVDARGRAQRLDERHRLDGSATGANPSSSVWRLVDSIAASRAERGATS